ncbi:MULTISPECIES: hypothetical protein [Bradyrhizobium]|jgi:hypothetical protein|uniref:DUF2188 domain-containing protein n=2 Tax=Bradyrhizobium TaxID=374 RepID=A0ABV4FPC4_9BRAD|nr:MULTISPECIES: hypothetical protein [Bradyrhizobium]MBR1293538.1 hypothetical protein [Bradyrhizobium ottawaense]MBR1330746.1 hypothetical protein [Bradyrhizobium ottawaense]MBR1337515.1 hypothetical protein [Bradyrhizobium ottawaense]MBR1365031.1 hypothetical protein [Bradyrhizobium ottawaense]WLB45850.1 hypothetical protein QIH93_36125 [Bradyrhizobium ottawaense]
MARAIRVPYLVSATNEYGCANLGRGSASLALRLARKFLRDGAIDVKVCTPRGRVLQSDELDELAPPDKSQKETDMAKGQQRGNRETKKPKKDKAKVIAAAPSRKDVAWQPDFGPGKKK